MSDFKGLVNYAWDAAWNRGQVDALDEIVHPDYLLENARTGRSSGLAELKEEVLEMRASLPDLVTTVDKIIVDGDDYAIFWSVVGTFSNPLRGVPATGRRVQTRGAIQGVLRDDRILSEFVTWDLGDEMMADMGLPRLRSAFEEFPESTDWDSTDVEPVRDAVRGFNRQFITGVTVVTTMDEEGLPRGLAANSYASVSFDPPLVMICVQKSTSTHDPLFKSNYLGINIMSASQYDTVRVFASKSLDKFAEVEWYQGPNGSPLIKSSAASIEAEIKERYQAKTHTVFIARVTHGEYADVDPIIYKAGRFYDGASLKEL